MSRNFMRRQRISLPGGRGSKRKRSKESNYFEEYRQRNSDMNSAFYKRASTYQDRRASTHQDFSNSNLEQDAEYRHTWRSTNAGKYCRDQGIFDQRKNFGNTSKTARTNMKVSASVAAPSETNNIATHLHCVDEMSTELFLHQASQRMDTLEVTEKDFNLLTDIAYKATVLSMRINEKKADEDLKGGMNAPTFIPGLTLIEQSYGSPSKTRSEFLQEAKGLDQLNKNNPLSIELSNASISTVEKEFLKEDRYRLCIEGPSTSVATPSLSKEPLISTKIIAEARKVLQQLTDDKEADKNTRLGILSYVICKRCVARRKNLNETIKLVKKVIDYLEAEKRSEMSSVHRGRTPYAEESAFAEEVKMKKVIKKEPKEADKSCDRSSVRRGRTPYAEGSAFAEEVKTKKVIKKEPKEADIGISLSKEQSQSFTSTVGTFLGAKNNSWYESHPSTSNEQLHTSFPPVGRKFLPEIRKHKPVYETPKPTCSCPPDDVHCVDCCLRYPHLYKF